MLPILRHVHMICVILFIISFTIKALLLLTNNNTSLKTYRDKTLIIENLFAFIFLATGLYMWYLVGVGNMGGWFHLKLTLVVMTIPIGIIGIKKRNKLVTTVALLLFLYILLLAFLKHPTLIQ